MKTTARLPFPARTSLSAPAWLPTLSSFFVIALFIYLVLAQMVPAAAVPASAPAADFSASRAFEHLKTIARAPHPTGSPESFVVRDYLFSQLAALGLQPEIQTSTSVYHDTGKWGVSGAHGIESTDETWSLAGATVHNVMARIPGTASTGAVVLAAHYDSVPYGPGASDDGAGTAAILEAARAVLASPPLQNDVILMLTDGEEIGLMGSQAFAKSHPWMNDIALVLNLEARGSSGVALMYETSEENSWLVSEYAKVAKDPVTSSLATDVWRIMPNSSDLTAFLQAGKQGMNFAYSENWTDYHTTHDSLEDIDQRSLQHHGDNALALVRHFGNLDLSVTTSGDEIFFSVLHLGIIHYSKSMVIPLMVLAVAATIGVFWFGFKRSRLTLRGIATGILALLVAMAVSALAAYLLVQGLTLLKGEILQVGMGGTYNVELYELGLLTVYLALVGITYAFFQRRARPAELAAGALLFWLVLAVGSSLILPGGSYLFLWPLLVGLAVLGLVLTASHPPAPLQRVLVLLPVIVGLLLFGTAIYLVQRMFGVAILPAGGIMTALLLALAFPYLEFRHLPRPAVWAAVPAVAGVFLLAWVGITTDYNTAQPRQNFLFYSMDADNSSASWVADTNFPDETLSPWLGAAPVEASLEEVFPGSWDKLVWTNAAPVLDEAAPELVVVQDKVENGARFLRLNLKSPRGAWAVMADVTAKGAILEGELYGQKYSREEPRDSLFFKVISVPPEGIEIGLKVLPGTPVSIRIADVSLSLPPLEGSVVAEISPERTGFGGGHGIDQMTLVHRRYTLD